MMRPKIPGIVDQNRRVIDYITGWGVIPDCIRVEVYGLLSSGYHRGAWSGSRLEYEIRVVMETISKAVLPAQRTCYFFADVALGRHEMNSVAPSTGP